MTTIANSLALVCSFGLRFWLVHTPLTWSIPTWGAPASTLPCPHRSRHTHTLQQLLPQQKHPHLHLPTLLVRDLQSRHHQLAGLGILATLLALSIITRLPTQWPSIWLLVQSLHTPPQPLQPSPATFAPASLIPAYSLIRFHPG